MPAAGTSAAGGVPTATAGATLTRAQIEAWDITHLETAAVHWSTTAQAWEGHFDTIHQGTLRPGGTVWEGDAADTAAERSWGDLVKVRGAADGLHSASGFARNGAEDIAWAKRQVLTAIEEAEQAGFTVEQNLSVTDKNTSPLMRVPAGRQQQAQAFAVEIGSRAKTLVTMDKAVAGKITAALAHVRALRFEEAPAPKEPSPAVQAVDYQFKQDEPKPNPNGDGRNPKFPDHKPNGEWAPGNSGVDGHAAAQNTFDEMESLGIPLIRQEVQIRVFDPATGKMRTRKYDALRPTGVPGQYIGIEHKTNDSPFTENQTAVDALVNAGTPARGTLNGQPIEVVQAQEVRVPWPPPEANVPAPAPAPGASRGYPRMPEPPKMWKDDGQPLIPRAGDDPFPTWGTHISPDELAKSGDPELSNLGKFYQGMFGRDPNDPDNHA